MINLIFLASFADDTITCHQSRDGKPIGKIVYRKGGIRPHLGELRPTHRRDWLDNVELLGWDD